MSVTRARPRLVISSNGPQKQTEFDSKQNPGNLSPDLQPSTPPEYPNGNRYNALKLGKYIILDQLDNADAYRAQDTETGKELVCKIFSLDKYREHAAIYWRVSDHRHLTAIAEIVLGQTKAYVFFSRGYGDLHSYVRRHKRLREDEARRLFRQIVSAVRHCHENDIVLRDLKLRKFVFKDPQRAELRLDGLEDACVIDAHDDKLTDKHGCPAYVSPEILSVNESYSGRAADVWSLGVMLYTILVGRYPFHDSQPSVLFGKIRRGQYTIPDALSSRAKCLIKSLLRRDPDVRLSAEEILLHPWFSTTRSASFGSRVDRRTVCDQTVPELTEPVMGDSCTQGGVVDT